VSTIVWFRHRDLRLDDHPALTTAAKRGAVIPVYVIDRRLRGPGPEVGGSARKHRLHRALAELARAFDERGAPLVLLEGPAEKVLPALVAATGASMVVAQRSVEPPLRAVDDAVTVALEVPFELHDHETLLPPGAILTQAGEPYRVFGAFARAFERSVDEGRTPVPVPLDAPVRLQTAEGIPGTPSNAVRGLVLSPDAGALSREVESGIAGAEPWGTADVLRRFDAFIAERLADYPAARDQLALDGTSGLSPDLALGVISAARVWHRVVEQEGEGAEKFRKELLWRELAHHTLHEVPSILSRPFERTWDGFPWREDAAGWDAWVEGRTGYPVVDAAARELLQTGRVHNRARMIAASVLTKHLMIDYRRGAAHYLAHLEDACLANNTLGWQWTSGCGLDAAPYFRVFNPVTQGQRFDADGSYVRRWVPELSEIPAKFVHRPWEAPAAVLERANVRLGTDFPRPVVDHRTARERYLENAAAHLRKRR
jgi:deoxyribodipyrimidine photo-lyase